MFGGVNFDWNLTKADLNLRKHGVDFLDAIAAVLDPDRIEDEDMQFVYDEQRTQVIGMTARGVLFVVIVYRGFETCRIISARKANRHEQNRYFSDHR